MMLFERWKGHANESWIGVWQQLGGEGPLADHNAALLEADGMAKVWPTVSTNFKKAQQIQQARKRPP